MNILNTTFFGVAKTYNLWAKHQQLAAARLIKLLPDIQFGRILDAGCGTGLLTQMAYNRYRNATLLGIDRSKQMINYCQTHFGHIKNMNFLVHDLEKLNKVGYPLDLILSNFTFQWISNIDCVFETFVESLIPDGYFGIAVPIEGSLFELYNSFKSAFDFQMPGLDYRNPDDYILALKQHSLSICISQIEDICVSFYGIDILRYFKYTGTTCRCSSLYRPATVKEINKLLVHYEQNYGSNGELPMTFKVFFVVAQKKINEESYRGEEYIKL